MNDSKKKESAEHGEERDRESLASAEKE